MNKSQQGFTLVELVTVIILIGILAVNVLPKFDGTASYEAHSHRAQLISALRLTQLRAMQQTDSTDNYCHQLIFDDHEDYSRYGIPDRINCATTVFPNGWLPDETGFSIDVSADGTHQVSFGIDGKTNPSAVTFDSMGRPIANDSTSLPNNCVGGCTINVQQGTHAPLQIKIESEGYIHAI